MTSPERQVIGKVPETFELNVAYPSQGLPCPEAANWFQLAVAGDEIQLSVGYLDPREIADVLAAGKQNSPVTATVTHRFFVSRQAFGQLRTAVEQVAGLLDQQSVRR